MHLKHFLIHFIAIILLIFAPFISQKKSEITSVEKFFIERNQHISHDLPHEFTKDARALFLNYVTGLDRYSFSAKVKKEIQTLNLQHLFTPSGLHFSLFIALITFFLNRINRRVSSLAIYLISFFFLFQTAFLPMRKIVLIFLIRSITRKFKFELSSYTLLFFAFFVDFLLGGYHASPLSFTFSFLFLGVIFATEREAFIFPHIIVAQFLIIIYFGKDFALLGIFLGVFMTSIFPLFFIPSLILYSTGIMLLAPIVLPLIKLNLWLLNFCYQLTLLLPTIQLSLIIVVPFFLYYYFGFKIGKKAFIISSIIFMAPIAGYQQAKDNVQVPLRADQIKSARTVPYGLEVTLQNDVKCRLYVEMGTLYKCYPLKARGY